MGEGYAVETSPWTSVGAMFWEVEARYKVEIATNRTRIWLGDRIQRGVV